MPDSTIDVQRLQRECLVSHVEHYATLTSTNDRARDIALDLPADEMALVIADEQTVGRGRGANRWWTGAGSLACSLVFDPAAQGIKRQHFPLISLATAVAIVDAVRPTLPPGQLGLHWPNDVFAAGRKLAGILIEGLPNGKHVLGIGVNVNNRVADAPAELRERATSLADLTRREHSRTDVLVELLGRLWPNLGQLAANSAEVGRRADRACLQHGRPLVLQSGDRQVAGTCVKVADDGALVLRTERGEEKFYSGVLIHS
ncbi:MAG TPA: biotin--[acetyl-CoA-carboxylase] ligase [Pirellulales bacterium]|jgi:BirA family biotin operon repressor/biotin-[acetyl-CoA-carboxylase] ligase